MLMSEKITLCVAAWTIFLLFVTSDAEIEIFFILIIIGFIFIKEFTDRFTTSLLKFKMNAFIFVFMIVFIVIIITKIMNILEI
jgi:hypothetical protein